MKTSSSFKIEATSSEIILNEPCRLAYEHWQQLKGDKALPRWADYDIVSVPEILPWTVHIDVIREDGEPHFIYHLIGNRIADIYGDSTGKDVQSADFRAVTNEQIANRALRIFRIMESSAASAIAHGNSSVKVPGTTNVEFLVLPFTDDAAEISNALAVLSLY